MIVDEKRINDISKQTGFRDITTEKVLRLAEIIRNVQSHPFLKDRLALKGGTAINMFLCSPPKRLSVDCHYDYIGSVDLLKTRQERPKLEEAIKAIANRLSYGIETSGEDHAGIKFFLKYKNILALNDRIEVDIFYMHRIPLGDLQKLEMFSFDNDMPPTVATLCSTEEIVSGKFKALVERYASRDYFDAWHIPSLFQDSWPTQRLKKFFVLCCGGLNHPLTKFNLERLDKLEQENVDSKLVPMLSKETPVLVEDLCKHAKKSLAPLLDLDDAEKEYTERIQYGDYLPELLFPDELEFAEKLKKYPAVLWKVKNAREFHKRDTDELHEAS